MPKRRVVQRLRGELLDYARDGIVCVDSSGNVGIVEPQRLLRFLIENAILGDKAASLSKNLPTPSLPFPEYHITGVLKKNSQFLKDHFSMRIGTGLTHKPAPGQFLQVMCDSAPHRTTGRYRSSTYTDRHRPVLRGIELREKKPFLRRPFSIASYGPPSQKHTLADARRLGAQWIRLVQWTESEFEIIFRKLPEGPGTTALADYAAGDTIDVIGPLGRGFTLTPPPETALLVGGGIGAPPLLFLAEELIRDGVTVKVFLGAASKSRLPFPARGAHKDRIARFERLGVSPVVCTDDGSSGRRGLVTEALVEHIEREGVDPKLTKVFACGPRPMLAALNGIANRFGLVCEALLEEMMACGFGACISCVCAVKEAGQRARFTRICTEGPAFDVRTVMWNA